MSNIEDLKKQVESLNSQITNMGQQLKGVLAQCKASKQLVDELTNSNVILRTNLLLHQEHSATRDEKLKLLEEAQVKAPVSPVKDTKVA